jgi:hypothetical protein
MTKSAPRIVERGVTLYPRPAGDSRDSDATGGVADKSPEWTREDQRGPRQTKALTLVPLPAAGPYGDEASARQRIRHRVTLGPDRLHWYATCESDGKSIGQLNIIAHDW